MCSWRLLWTNKNWLFQRKQFNNNIRNRVGVGTIGTQMTSLFGRHRIIFRHMPKLTNVIFHDRDCRPLCTASYDPNKSYQSPGSIHICVFQTFLRASALVWLFRLDEDFKLFIFIVRLYYYLQLELEIVFTGRTHSWFKLNIIYIPNSSIIVAIVSHQVHLCINEKQSSRAN